MARTLPSATGEQVGVALATPAARYLAVCPIASCAKVSTHRTREGARDKDRAHWQRVHAAKHPRLGG